MQIDIFKHIFELLWGLPNCTHILVCHSVTSIQISGYHTPTRRGYTGLSYDPKCLKISCQIRELELDYMSMWESPRTSGVIREQELVETFRWDKPSTCKLQPWVKTYFAARKFHWFCEWHIMFLLYCCPDSLPCQHIDIIKEMLMICKLDKNHIKWSIYLGPLATDVKWHRSL